MESRFTRLAIMTLLLGVILYAGRAYAGAFLSFRVYGWCAFLAGAVTLILGIVSSVGICRARGTKSDKALGVAALCVPLILAGVYCNDFRNVQNAEELCHCMSNMTVIFHGCLQYREQHGRHFYPPSLDTLVKTWGLGEESPKCRAAKEGDGHYRYALEEFADRDFSAKAKGGFMMVWDAGAFHDGGKRRGVVFSNGGPEVADEADFQKAYAKLKEYAENLPLRKEVLEDAMTCSKCQGNLLLTGTACFQYQKSSGDGRFFPPSIGFLVEAGLLPVTSSGCPADPAEKAFVSAFEEFSDREFSREIPSSLMMLWDRIPFHKGRIGVAYFDCHTSHLNEAEFQKEHAKLKQYAEALPKRK